MVEVVLERNKRETTTPHGMTTTTELRGLKRSEWTTVAHLAMKHYINSRFLWMGGGHHEWKHSVHSRKGARYIGICCVV